MDLQTPLYAVASPTGEYSVDIQNDYYDQQMNDEVDEGNDAFTAAEANSVLNSENFGDAYYPVDDDGTD